MNPKISSAQAGRYALGALGCATFLLGLLLAARGEAELSTAGLFLALASLLLVFWQIKRAFDAYDADPDRPRKPAYAPPVPDWQGTPPHLEEDPLKGKPKHVFEGGWARPARERQPFLATFDPDSQKLVKGILLAALALGALFVGARGDGWAYYGGLFVAFVFVALIFALIAEVREIPRPRAGMLRWIVGGVVGLAGIVGLFVAAGSHGPGYYVGLIVAGIAIAYLFHLIKTSFDEAEARRHG
jgi:hypothetical protein